MMYKNIIFKYYGEMKHSLQTPNSFHTLTHTIIKSFTIIVLGCFTHIVKLYR